MTDVRAILEAQAERRTRQGKVLQYGTAVLAAVSILVFAALHVGGKQPDFTLLYIPLLFVGGAAAYSPKHVQALKEAIADPDPALDAHFADCLVSERKPVVAIGRQAFLERFRDRLPQLDAEGWDRVGWGLKDAPTDDAERLLRLMAQGAPLSALERVEDLLRRTKVERLRTAAHQTLGDIRLRAARERVRAATDEAGARTQDESTRLGLTESVRQS